MLLRDNIDAWYEDLPTPLIQYQSIATIPLTLQLLHVDKKTKYSNLEN